VVAAATAIRGTLSSVSDLKQPAHARETVWRAGAGSGDPVDRHRDASADEAVLRQYEPKASI
jgi:hypothetical protein